MSFPLSVLPNLWILLIFLKNQHLVLFRFPFFISAFSLIDFWSVFTSDFFALICYSFSCFLKWTKYFVWDIDFPFCIILLVIEDNIKLPKQYFSINFSLYCIKYYIIDVFEKWTSLAIVVVYFANRNKIFFLFYQLWRMNKVTGK